MNSPRLSELLGLHRDDLGLVLTVPEQIEQADEILRYFESLVASGQLPERLTKDIRRWRMRLERLTTTRTGLVKSRETFDHVKQTGVTRGNPPDNDSRKKGDGRATDSTR
jgi:hypothetical protein